MSMSPAQHEIVVVNNGKQHANEGDGYMYGIIPDGDGTHREGDRPTRVMLYVPGLLWEMFDWKADAL